MKKKYRNRARSKYSQKEAKGVCLMVQCWFVPSQLHETGQSNSTNPQIDRMVNREWQILLQDNTPPHVAKTTLLRVGAKLRNSLLSTSIHIPCNYWLHFLQALDLFLQGKRKASFDTSSPLSSGFSYWHPITTAKLCRQLGTWSIVWILVWKDILGRTFFKIGRSMWTDLTYDPYKLYSSCHSLLFI